MNFTIKVEPYEWQKELNKKFFSQNNFNKDGIIGGAVEICTGGGKSIGALLVASNFLKVTDGIVSIIVPTIALLEQWKRKILTETDTKRHEIATLNGGVTGDIRKAKIIISTIQSAWKNLQNVLIASGKNLHLGHLMIVDEAHRTRSSKFSKIYKIERFATLGLSGTLDDYKTPYENTVLKEYIGPKLIELRLKEAINLGILPEFHIDNYGIELTHIEAVGYEHISRKIAIKVSQIMSSPVIMSAIATYNTNHSPKISTNDIEAICRAFQNRFSVCAECFVLIRQRKELLYMAENRLKLIEHIIQMKKDQGIKKILIFHESIIGITRIYEHLSKKHVTMLEHSKIPLKIRNRNLKMFERTNNFTIYCSCSTLNEGIDIPAIDCMINAAINTNPAKLRQRVGRGLRVPVSERELYEAYRKNPSPERKKLIENTCQKKQFINIYVTKTVDESQFRNVDQYSEFGNDRVGFHFVVVDKDNHVLIDKLNEAPKGLKSLEMGNDYTRTITSKDFFLFTKRTKSILKRRYGKYVMDWVTPPMSLISFLDTYCVTYSKTENLVFTIQGNDVVDVVNNIYVCQCNDRPNLKKG